jgi:hypothetical protein
MPAANVSRRTAGECSGRTARVHVCEESDSGIVPMNQSGTFPTQSGCVRVPRVGECADKLHAWPLFICDKSRMR